MSWDILIMNYRGNPPRVENMTDDDRPFCIGNAGHVRELINKQLSGVDWSDPSWGIYKGEGFSLEFSIGAEDEKDSFMVHVRGGGDPVATLMKISNPNDWSLLDCSSGDFIDPNRPEKSAWGDFQKYRDQIISTESDNKT
ncbi:hypothetical protein [Marinobacterium sp. BA1]|uniref:hypothetical protein n=1 Tax=Marinobacterium sp. BA1 TaxID=3138931 RepID=UPI0032E7D94D